jgi:hypothetical protein
MNSTSPHHGDARFLKSRDERKRVDMRYLCRA